MSEGYAREQSRCWAEIDLIQLVRNLRIYQSGRPAGSDIMAVVKADAYGHGMEAVAGKLAEEGIRHYAVATLEEGVVLRRLLPAAHILILGYTDPVDAPLLSEYRLTQTLLSREFAETLAQNANGPIECCYALDTGMRRIGLNADDPDEAEAAIRAIRVPLRLTGLMTHLCAADTPQEPDSVRFTALQLERFRAVSRRVADLKLSWNHALNSAGGLFTSLPGMVRLGILLYGLKPDDTNVLPEGMAPVLSWKCRVAMVKRIHAGDTVGYGRTWTAPGDRMIATLTVGYADGYSRLLSNRGYVLLHGRKAPIVGRVCMDQTMVDVTEIPETCMGDAATLLGTDGNESLTADDMAALTGTIGYEVVCGISARVPRIISSAACR